VADKDVKVSEAAAEAAPAEPAAAAQIDQSDLEPSDLEQSEIAQSEIEQPEIGKSETEQPEIGKSETVRPEEGRPGAGRRRAWRAAAALGAATVVLGGFGVWATLQANSVRSGAAAQNTALTDGPATAAVRREIAAAVNTIFSYNYANTAATRRAAQGLLTGPAVREYDTLFALVTKNAPAQKLVVTTRVTNAGVELLNGDRARLLVFANQQDTRAGTGQTSYAGAMFAVTALRQGGRWKIENIDTFSG
jgi:Mce-associated membrane protein